MNIHLIWWHFVAMLGPKKVAQTLHQIVQKKESKRVIHIILSEPVLLRMQQWLLEDSLEAPVREI